MLGTLSLLSVSAFGQGVSSTSAGTVAGLVTDPSNAVVPAATVTLTDKSTNQTRNTTTDSTGRFVFIGVNPGTYDVTVTKIGFSKASVVNQAVIVGTTTTVNATLQVGAETTTITVESTGGAELQTLNSTVSNTIENRELLELPNLGRDASTLATLQPGSNSIGNTAGAASDQNTFQLDGGSVTDDMSGDTNTYIPSFSSNTAGVGVYHSAGYSQAPSGVIPTPVESIEEMKVAVANQTADFNQGGGSQVQMVTKRGTSSFHGAAYEYYLDDNFGGANTWDNNNTQTKQPSYHYNRFGLAAGGPLVPFDVLGGKTFIFGNYEGFRYPQTITYDHVYPTASLRAGIIKLNGQVINLNSTPTVDPATGNTIQPTACPAGPCDPLGKGINPVVQNLWNQYLPLPNDFNAGDGLNYAGYKAPLSLAQKSNFGVVRLDHDFGQKWHFNSTYHFYRLDRATSNQVDVGGFFPGDVKGQYKSTSNRPQIPWFYTGGLTTNITQSMTNDLHYSFTRNYWAYQTHGGVPNVAGFPAALEIGGETSSSNFTPYNTNNQSTRTRYWNGHDNMLRDDVSWLKGNHLFQFGGIYQRNSDTHERIDNGGAINTYEQYLIGLGNSTGAGITMTGYIPAGVTSTRKYGNLYAEALGIVSQTQSLYTRSNGATLNLNPRGSCAISGIAATAGCVTSPPGIEHSIIPEYNVYFSDTWKMRPNLTLTYGLGWTVEMPPYEPNGNQDIAVDQNGNILNTANYLAAREQAALQGQAYDPPIGFATIKNVNGHPKYPYNTFYGGISPRLSAAWSPTSNTVIRGGWARIFGRLNGVDQVLVPILAPGLLQVVQCPGPTVSGSCGADPTTAFRVGVNGTNAFLTPPTPALPQPWYPGINAVATGAGEALDPNFKPNRSDEFNLSVQKLFGPKVSVEVGYIGRIIRNEYQAYNLNAVPYMMTMGGQRFDKAWAAIMQATNFGNNPNAVVPVQPFFEAALNKSYCANYSSCTAAFVANEGPNGTGNMGCACVWDAWTDVSTAGMWNFGRSMINDPTSNATLGANGQTTSVFMNASNGYGNYNAGFFQVSFNDFHGLSMRQNFTYSKSLGTGNVVQASSQYTVTDPWNLHNMYGVQPYDEKYTYNMYFTYSPPFFRNQQGALGRVLGGWSWSSLLVAGSGFPVEVNTANGSCESYGEGYCNDLYTYENAIALPGFKYSATRYQGIAGNSGVGTGGPGQNVFQNPAAAFNLLRNPVLGLDGDIGGGGNLRGFPFWNVDMSLSKNLKFSERLNTTLYVAFTNVFNHMQVSDPQMNLYDPANFGTLVNPNTGLVQANDPRRMELGLRIGW